MPSELDKATRRAEDRARRRALELRRRNATTTEIADVMASIVAEAALPGLWAAATLSAAQRTYQWVADRTLPATEQRAVAGFVRGAANQFAVVAGKLQTAVADAATRAIREGLPASELESLLANKFGKAERHARTIARTALGAFDRADTMRQAQQAGVQKFRYVGPPGSRDFCQHHLAASRHKTYTLEEIGKLNNGQGLPVLYYGGGWNCRHTWEPVIEKALVAPEVIFSNDKRAMRKLTFAQNEEDRDDITRQHFNGKVTLSVAPDVDEVSDILLGRTLSEREHLRLCGAMDGADVLVAVRHDSIIYYVRHPFFEYPSERFLTIENGPIELHNNLLRFKQNYQGLGLGPRIVTTGLLQAQLLGVEVITVQAAGNPHSDWKGYLQWPKMGFDAKLPPWMLGDVPEPLKGKVQRFTDFLIYPEGLKWWAENGDSMNLTFDLKTESLSQIVLLEYLKYKRIVL